MTARVLATAALSLPSPSALLPGVVPLFPGRRRGPWLAHNPSWQRRAKTARSFLDRNDNGHLGHLFPRGDDAAELAAAERLLLG